MTVDSTTAAGVMAQDPLADTDRDTPEQTADTAGPEPAALPPDAVALGTSLTIADVGELSERLRAGLDLGYNLKIHAADVEQMDAAGIQLLCAVARDARNQGLEVVWNGVSERLNAAVRQLGLEDEEIF